MLSLFNTPSTANTYRTNLYRTVRFMSQRLAFAASVLLYSARQHPVVGKQSLPDNEIQLPKLSASDLNDFVHMIDRNFKRLGFLEKEDESTEVSENEQKRIKESKVKGKTTESDSTTPSTSTSVTPRSKGQK